jgi:hypothetical protein
VGSHVWVEECPYCGFEDVVVSSYNGLYFEVACQICGYARWTEDRVPDNHDAELAKRALSKMGDKEKRKAVELYCEDNIPLVARLRQDCPNEADG